MDQRRNLLGEYLRARRALVSPAEFGFAAGNDRKVGGLRREEVALLAGVSTSYYLRLEQGRARNPSLAVLESLAYALKLDQTAVSHLKALAAHVPASAQRWSSNHTVRQGIHYLIASLNQPAMVVDRHFDVLASNALAAAFSPSFQVGENRVVSTFLDRAEMEQHLDWDRSATRVATALRASVGTMAGDSRTSELVDSLSLRSKRFRELWSRHDVGPTTGEITVPVRHSRLGDMQVTHERLPVSGADGQLLVITSAEPDTESAEKLRWLASSVARG